MNDKDTAYFATLSPEDKEKFLAWGPWWAQRGLVAHVGPPIIPVPERTE